MRGAAIAVVQHQLPAPANLDFEVSDLNRRHIRDKSPECPDLDPAILLVPCLSSLMRRTQIATAGAVEVAVRERDMAAVGALLLREADSAEVRARPLNNLQSAHF